MTTYNNIFNGNFVQPSSVSYANLVLTKNTTLTWPTSYLDNSTNIVLAEVMTIQANSAPPQVIDLANNPITTVDLSSYVTVSISNNSGLLSGTNITISGANALNAITAPELNITAPIFSIVGSTAFTYLSGGTANASSSGGGNAVVLSYSIPYIIFLPDATQVSIGQQTTFVNNGANPFVISDNAQNYLVTLQPGNSYDLILTNNSTTGGSWVVMQRGTSTALSNANALAGYGLNSSNGFLNTNITSKTINGNYQTTLADRGSIIVWNGGVGTITLLPDAPNGYYVAVNNSGAGIVTMTTSDSTFIDGSASFPLNPTESCQFIETAPGGSPGWNTFGFGQETYFQVNTLSLSLAASSGGTLNLTNSQSARIVQTYTGVLTGNVIVTFPAAAGQWYVFNDTTGAFTVTMQLYGAGGGIVIPQGEKLVFYSDGVTLFTTPTIVNGTVNSPGTVGSPGITFSNDSTTGFYSPTAGEIGFSSGGTAEMLFSSNGLSINNGNSLVLWNSANTFFTALDSVATADTVWNLPPKDASTSGQIIYSDAASNLNFTTASYPLSTTINRILYSTANNTIGQISTVDNGVLVTSGAGVPSISTTLPATVQSNITGVGTIVSGIWEGTGVTVPFGGTGKATFTAYSVVCAGTTATGTFQNVVGVGTANQFLVSNGAAALPSWQSIITAKAFIFDLSDANPLYSNDINIASIVRNSVGNYTVTWSNSYADVSYITLLSVNNIGTGHQLTSWYNSNMGSLDIYVYSINDAAFFDANAISLTVLGL